MFTDYLTASVRIMHASQFKVVIFPLIYALYRVNESLVSQLESEIFEAKLQLERHNEKLLSEIYTSTNLKASIDTSM